MHLQHLKGSEHMLVAYQPPSLRWAPFIPAKLGVGHWVGARPLAHSDEHERFVWAEMLTGGRTPLQSK